LAQYPLGIPVQLDLHAIGSQTRCRVLSWQPHPRFLVNPTSALTYFVPVRRTLLQRSSEEGFTSCVLTTMVFVEYSLVVERLWSGSLSCHCQELC